MTNTDSNKGGNWPSRQQADVSKLQEKMEADKYQAMQGSGPMPMKLLTVGCCRGKSRSWGPSPRLTFEHFGGRIYQAFLKSLHFGYVSDSWELMLWKGQPSRGKEKQKLHKDERDDKSVHKSVMQGMRFQNTSRKCQVVHKCFVH